MRCVGSDRFVVPTVETSTVRHLLVPQRVTNEAPLQSAFTAENSPRNLSFPRTFVDVFNQRPLRTCLDVGFTVQISLELFIPLNDRTIRINRGEEQRNRLVCEDVGTRRISNANTAVVDLAGEMKIKTR